MRHRCHSSKLNRTSEHRAALLRNLAIALITNERIRTTKVKATQLRPFVETLLTMARQDTIAAKRLIVSRLGDKDTARKLWGELVPRVGERPGGYLRIVKDGIRMGDGAPMAWIEFVDAKPAPAEGEVPPQKKTIKQRLHERRKEAAKARKGAAA